MVSPLSIWSKLLNAPQLLIKCNKPERKEYQALLLSYDSGNDIQLCSWNLVGGKKSRLPSSPGSLRGAGLTPLPVYFPPTCFNLECMQIHRHEVACLASPSFPSSMVSFAPPRSPWLYHRIHMELDLQVYLGSCVQRPNSKSLIGG
jgi:hypothetical protein